MKNIILSMLLCLMVLLLIGCEDRYAKQRACLAEGHVWYFNRMTWRRSSEDPNIDLAVHVWECEKCSVEMSKIYVELTSEQQTAIMALTPSGNARIFRVR